MSWLKKVSISLIALAITFIAVFHLQIWQYLQAYAGGGFARALPETESYGLKTSCNAQPLRVMSFNVMYGSALIEAMAKRFRGGDTGEGDLPWSARIPGIRQRIEEYSPDLLGLQEMESDADVNAIAPLDQYSLVSYHLGNFQYGDSALLFKTSRFEQLDSGQVWLGPKPELPMSLGFLPIAMVRYVNWALLREKTTGFTFMFVNTHFDNESINKRNSSILFRKRVASLAHGIPMVVTGDFNNHANTQNYDLLSGTNESPTLLKNAYTLVGEHLHDKLFKPENLIDHIFVGGPCRVKAEQWLVDSRPNNTGKPLSDHNLVFAQLRFSS